jgi:FkbM family methyltransferase
MQIVKHLPKFLVRHKIIDYLVRSGLQTNSIEINFNRSARAFVDLADPEPRNVYIKRVFEPHFFEIANSFLPTNGTFFDVGSNVGFCTFGLIPKKPNVKYHLFEANHELINLIEKSISLHKKSLCSVVNACVNDRDGFTKFHISTNQTGQSHVASGSEIGLSVKNIVLDNYCRDKCIKKIDFVKIDLEGNEIPALKGFEQSLTNQTTTALYIEVIPENQKRYNYTSFELLSYLESLGYTLFLCKYDDFGCFGNPPTKKVFKHGTLTVSKFAAIDYPHNFATDVLVVSNKYLNNS